MPETDGIYWTTDAEFFAMLPGGRELVEWFGSIPSFHDATLESFRLSDNTATLVLRTFRMTDRVDENGYFVLDRHARITIDLREVSALSLVGSADATIAHLGIRAVVERPAGRATVAEPAIGDVELGWDSSYGLEGTIFARQVSLSLEPL